MNKFMEMFNKGFKYSIKRIHSWMSIALVIVALINIFMESILAGLEVLIRLGIIGFSAVVLSSAITSITFCVVDRFKKNK